MNDRMISFEKISNARDLGGLKTVQGRMISPGLLLRSANLSEATEADFCNCSQDGTAISQNGD